MQNVEIEYSPKSVQNILEYFFYFSNAIERGNMDAVVLISDMKVATKKANLTEQQKKVYFYRFLQEYTQAEVAEKFGMTHQGVNKHIDLIVKKVCNSLNGGVQ